MANVLLTERCVRNCPYCFAREHMDDSALTELSWDNLIYIADFLEISKEHKISLLGGEPTLHSHFVDFTTYLLERNFHVNVFTSGIMSKEKLKDLTLYLSKIPPERLSFTCNMNHPKLSTEKEIDQIHEFLKAFASFTTLGYNIYQTDLDLEFLVQYINKYKLRRHIRFGLAHPIQGGKNTYIPASELGIMAKKLVAYCGLFEQNNVAPGFDCGMPMCIFSEEELGKLSKANKGVLKFGCGPAIDTGPDMMVWSCFPLSGLHKKSLYEFNSMQEIHDYFKNIHNKVKAEIGGIFEKCVTCVYLTNEACMGGCIAHSINQLKDEQMNRIKAIYS